MCPVVTALTRQNKRKNLVNVFLDGEYAFSLEELTAASLHPGQVLSETQIEELREKDGANRAQEKALGLIEQRPRSRSELARRLRQAGFTDEAAAQALERLGETGLVDDLAFARFWVEQRQTFRPRSKQALRFELRRQGLDNTVIEAALEEVEDEQIALILAGKLSNKEKMTGAERKQKVAALLQRRGFSYGTINDVLSRLSEGEADEDIEFDIPPISGDE